MIWVQAPNIEGHEGIVEMFRKSSHLDNLPPEYLITQDEYWVNYKGNGYVASEISETMPYVPRRGTLTEATKLGRDEPDIFYKLLAKKNYDGRTKGNIYSTPCDLLFVRTKHKQIYKKTHKVRMFIDKEYHSLISRICTARGETEGQAKARMLCLQDVLSMECEFQFVETKIRPIRINAAQYESRKRRERRIEQATPRWANLREISALHRQVRRMNIEAGFQKYHLDHEIPLHTVNEDGEHIACGLHIPANLAPMLATENLKKSNIMRSEDDV